MALNDDHAASIKADLISAMEIEQLFQKHIIDGTSYFFRDFLNDGNKEYILRHEFSELLGLSINDIVIVGSAKLGFSVKNEKFAKFDERFSNTYKPAHKSDIDIAIVSRKLFDRETETIYDISRHFSQAWIDENWRHNVYYHDDSKLKQNNIDSIFNNYTKKYRSRLAKN